MSKRTTVASIIKQQKKTSSLDPQKLSEESLKRRQTQQELRRILSQDNRGLINTINSRSIELERTITWQDFCESGEFQNFAYQTLDFVLSCRGNQRMYALELRSNDTDDFLGYTNGKDIVINLRNELSAFPKNLRDKFNVLMGIMFHECAHRIFMDFNTMRKIMDSIENGYSYGSTNVGTNQEYQPALDDMEYMMQGNCRLVISKLYQELDNIIADGHDEARMKRLFPNFIAECIRSLGRTQFAMSCSLNEAVRRPNCNMLSIMQDMILFSCKLGMQKIKAGPHGAADPEIQPCLDLMKTIEPFVELAVNEDDLSKRWPYYNAIMVRLWNPVIKPLIQDLLEQAKKDRNKHSGGGSSGSSSGGSSSGGSSSGGSSGGSGSAPSDAYTILDDEAENSDGSDPNSSSGNPGDFKKTIDEATDDDVQEVVSQLDKSSQQNQQETGISPAPQNLSTDPMANQKITSKQTNKNAQEASAAFGADPLSQCLKNLAKASVQQEMDQATIDALRSMHIDPNSPHARASFSISHIRDFTDPATDSALHSTYNRIYKEVAAQTRNLTREIQNLLREHSTSYLLRNRTHGKIIEANRVYRKDNTFFADRKLPQDDKDLAVCFLIDLSGSMNGSKLIAAQKCAIMLQRFAANLDIPCMVAGHNSDHSHCSVKIYTDFAECNSDACYALGHMHRDSDCCNRDGLAIQVCGHLLSMRPEMSKVLIVISDGTPNDDDYGGDYAVEDIRSICQNFRNNGLAVYGAAIDGDREVIESIYGHNSFLSITDLNSMSRVMVRLLRQYLGL